MSFQSTLDTIPHLINNKSNNNSKVEKEEHTISSGSSNHIAHFTNCTFNFFGSGKDHSPSTQIKNNIVTLAKATSREDCHFSFQAGKEVRVQKVQQDIQKEPVGILKNRAESDDDESNAVFDSITDSNIIKMADDTIKNAPPTPRKRPMPVNPYK